MTSGGPSESPVKRHVAKEEGQPKFIIITVTGYSVTRKNTECCGLTGSKCLNLVSPQHTFRNSILCASISQEPNQLPKRSKVRCKEEEERIQIICKTQNRDLPPSGPFSQIYTVTAIASLVYIMYIIVS